MRYGVPNAMKMKIDLTRLLGNYVKKPEQWYQEYELGLRDLVNQLAAVKCPVPEDDIVMRLIAGMISDKRSEKETKEVLTIWNYTLFATTSSCDALKRKTI